MELIDKFCEGIVEMELLQGLKKGDLQAYEVLFHRYYPRFFHFAKGMLKEEQAAEDILQNVFMNIWIHRERIKPDQSFQSYLFVLCKREILNYFRLKYNKNTVLVNDMQVFTWSEEPEELGLDIPVLQQNVHSIIQSMPASRKEVFCLSRFKLLTNREIAERLGISIRTVEKHIQLAVRTFREQLGEFFMLALLLYFF